MNVGYRTDGAVADRHIVSMDHSTDTTLTPIQEKKRLSGLRLAEWTNQFAARLKANAQWIKRFLHGSN